MKIRSLKLLVEQDNITKVYNTGDGTSFSIPSDEYENKKLFLVYGEVEIGMIPNDNGKYLVVSDMRKDINIQDLAPKIA